MTKREWTVVWVPHGSGTSRSFGFSRRALQVMVGTLASLGVVTVVFVYTAITKAVDISRLERLERANDLLAQELVRTRSQLEEVGDSIAAIMERDRQVRLLAGLPPTDPDVQLAGIGGPAGAASEGDQLLADASVGREALRMRADVGALIRRANLLARSFQEATESLAVHVDRLARTPSISPTRGWITSKFTQVRIHPIFHDARPHEGIDISAPLGTPIVAPAGGLVIYVGTEPGYGRMVTIDHGYGVVTRYAHVSKWLVREGQRVRRGDQIALVGSTGVSTSPHLHYEVEVNRRTVDPRNYIFPESIVD